MKLIKLLISLLPIILPLFEILSFKAFASDENFPNNQYVDNMEKIEQILNKMRLLLNNNNKK